LSFTDSGISSGEMFGKYVQLSFFLNSVFFFKRENY